MVINFLHTTNAALLDELEVQCMKKWLPVDLAASHHPKTGCSAFFSYEPLVETTEDEPPAGIENIGGNKDTEMLQRV
jgi:hypothetical protein